MWWLWCDWEEKKGLFCNIMYVVYDETKINQVKADFCSIGSVYEDSDVKENSSEYLNKGRLCGVK